jgi:Tfp pilus assembly protein PilF
MIGIALLSILVLQASASGISAQEKAPPPVDANAEHRYVPPSASHSVEIGNFYLRRKEFKAALSRFEEAVKTDPHYALAYRGLGRVYERIGLRQKALDAYRRYLDELPSAQEAREAKQVHKAVARLQKQLASGRNSAGSPSTQQ